MPLITEKTENETTFQLPANTHEIVSSPTVRKSKKYKKKKNKEMLENVEPAKETDSEVVTENIEIIDGEILTTKVTSIEETSTDPGKYDKRIEDLVYDIYIYFFFRVSNLLIELTI